MNKRGKIAAMQSNKVKVYYDDIDIMTPYIDVANHVSDLQINDTVIVAVYNSDLRTGAVIGVIA